MVSERQLEINPFGDGTALRALRGVPSFEEALARLLHTAEHGRPFGIVRGPLAVGKSVLLQCVAEELRRSGNECGQIDLRRTFTSEFAWRIACELGAAPVSTEPQPCWRHIDDTLTGRALSGRLTVLIIDHLGESYADLQAQMQRLLSIVESSAGWCTVLTAARSESTQVDPLVLAHAELRIELGHLDVRETTEFVQRAVATSGCRPFDEDAIGAIHDRTRGVLRDMMAVCRLALIAAWAEDAREVTGDIVRMVSSEVAPPVHGRLQAAAMSNVLENLNVPQAVTAGQ